MNQRRVGDFDLDGTLIDSELGYEVSAAVLEKVQRDRDYHAGRGVMMHAGDAKFEDVRRRA